MRTLLVAAQAIISIPLMQAAELSRKATIEDISGVKTDVTDPRCSFHESSRFPSAYDAIMIKTADWDVAIPTSRLRSIKVSGSSAEVTYDWHGQTRTTSGELNAEIAGKSEFGDFKLDASKLRQLTFSTAPSANEQPSRQAADSATVILTNGTRVALSALKRHASYYSSEGYILGGTTRYHHNSDFSFMRGESLATLKFGAIAKLDFGPDEAVTVTLKSGSSASGKLSRNGDARVDGWTGESDQGSVFISPDAVRAIEFGER
jgi:hypothetical protein